MKILITGNMGYIGPVVTAHLRNTYPEAILIGYDTGYFGVNLTNASTLPESLLKQQFFGDIRKLPEEVLQGVDAVIHLAAISNDPMGKQFEDVTIDINFESSIRTARMAKKAGAKAFVFASSCSIYGAAGDAPKTEQSEVNPLTAYARSKVLTEQDLQSLADDNFTVTCLRFATACGMSPRLRLDLVLNDFVASAVVSGKINILSDGSPWRPLIHVKDMSRAMEWALERRADNGGHFIAVNTGTQTWNYQIKDLAQTVADVIPGTEVSINPVAAPDKRSYLINFNLFASLAPHHQPKITLSEAVTELKENLVAMHFKDEDFRSSHLIRLKALTAFQDSGKLDDQLEWTSEKDKATTQTISTASTL